jgi:hypothetical protein
MTTVRRLSETEKKLLRIMGNTGQVTACGIVEVRAAQRLVQWGMAEEVEDRRSSVDQWGAGALLIRMIDTPQVED